MSYDFTAKPHGTWDHADTYVPKPITHAISGHFELAMSQEYRDPFTPPHTKTDCARTCNGPVNSVYCCEYRTFYQWIYVTPTLIVDFAKVGDFMAIIHNCHDHAVAAGLVAGIIAAYMSGGAAGAKAAVDTYVAAVTACLVQKLPTVPLLSVRVEFRSHWGNWE